MYADKQHYKKLNSLGLSLLTLCVSFAASILFSSVAFAANDNVSFGSHEQNIDSTIENDLINSKDGSIELNNDSLSVIHSGVSGTCQWNIYSDGTLVLEPIDGQAIGIFQGLDWRQYHDEIVSFRCDGPVKNSTSSLSGFFQGFHNLESVDLTNFDTSNITDMSHMFGALIDSRLLTPVKLESVNFANIDTSNVTTMSNMFDSCWYLRDLDLSTLDVSSVNNMAYMFRDCRTLTNIDLSGWNPGPDLKCYKMFSGCSSLKNLNISSFVVNEPSQCENMLEKTPSLEYLTLGYFGNTFDALNCPTASFLRDGLSYDNAGMSKLSADQLMGGWTIEVKHWGSIDTVDWVVDSSGCLRLSPQNNVAVGEIDDFSNGIPWDYELGRITSFACDGDILFKGKSLSGMFALSSVVDVDLAHFNAPYVEDLSGMFKGCRFLELVDLSGLSNSPIAKVDQMFFGCDRISLLDLRALNLTNAESFLLLFANCYELNEVYLPNLLNSSVTDISNMFTNCQNLTSLNLNMLSTPSLTKMDRVFWGCTKLEQLDLSMLDTRLVDSAQYFFHLNPGLREISLGDNCITLGTMLPDAEWWCKDSNKSLHFSDFQHGMIGDFSGTWLRVKPCSVSFSDGCNGSVFDSVTYTFVVGDPSPCYEIQNSRPGYKFVGWSPDISEYVFNDVEYIAQWDSLSGEWLKTSSGYWIYLFDDGSRAVGVQTINGTLYNFDSNGYMTTGWYQDNDGIYYYFNGSGAAVTGWQQIGSTWYYFDEDHKMFTGHQMVSNWPVYFEKWGGLHTGWLYEDGIYRYYDGGGWMVYGWNYINGNYYYFDPSSGAMYTGLQSVGSNLCLFADWGGLRYGWQWADGAYYYFNNSGYGLTGWQYIDGYYYYFGDDARMWTGHQIVSNWPVYFESSGHLHYGWLYEDGIYQYYDGGGWMVYGWEYINGNYYFFDRETGVMATGLVRGINGNDYLFADWGGMRYGWQQLTNPDTGVTEDVYCTDSGALLKNDWKGWYYLGPDGFMLKNTVTPDGWQLNENGYATEWVG